MGALGRGYLATTPFLGLVKPGTERESERVLATGEIRAVWRALDALLAKGHCGCGRGQILPFAH